MSTPVAQLHRLAGKGRQPRDVERLRDQRDELEAHRQEALAFVDECWPLVSRLELAAQSLGPIAHQTAIALGMRLSRYERRHLEPEPDAPAVAA